ncbi:unnamed protein product [Bursaphelenchus xylophilus]|uniref:(pine wood nematode) hypothetical protein n=1 Tax=Bursaphelenchus xylophilus TaxID=6326 RepID=A0A1I7SCA8_BURXY|nr:unnamed protein product [Bursaphelenchus xylophilus]CAG9094454.1 unnamed protein product [Bursaphelenchus xylophilus]
MQKCLSKRTRPLIMIPTMLTTLALAQFNSSNIIDLPVSRFPEPKCTYNVLHDDRYGKQVIGKINIGDPLYHKWECDYGERTSVDIYCMMVHSCTVTSQRQQQPIEIIDEFGCTLFPQVISNIRYDADLKGGLKVQAFSLDVDEPAISFRCSIKLLLKLNGICRRPQCAVQAAEWVRKRRSIGRFNRAK